MSFSIWILASIYVGLPIIFMWNLYKGKKFQSKRIWWVEWLFTLSFILFVFLVGPWDTFLYYFRYIFVLSFVMITIVSVPKISSLPKKGPKGNKTYKISFGFLLILTFFFLFQSFHALSGYALPDGEKVELTFPLQDGIYSVGHGGADESINYHAPHPVQAYSYDISKMNIWGNRAKGLTPSDLEDYAIYNQKLYSPCTGTIEQAVDQYEDVPPMEAADGKVDEPAGNHIAIQCKGVTVWIAHMKPGSLKVGLGGSVAEGEWIGRVGNSGNTTEPHLHIHAAKDGEGLPITFNGRFLKRNSLVFRGE